MARNRNTKDPFSKQSSISSISSHVPLMAASKPNDRQSNTQPSTDVESILNSLQTNSNRDSKRSRTVHQPKGTVSYTVNNSDTIEKIALRFNLTPSELRQLNKLNSGIVFPGQTLYVPDTSSSSSNNEPRPSIPLISPSASTVAKNKDDDAFILLSDRRLSSGSSPQSNQQDVGAMVWAMTRQTNAKPGHVERLKSDASTESESSSNRTIEDRLKMQKEDNTRQVQRLQKTLSTEESQQIDEECLQRFIKLNVRLMTDDHKSVAGTLLVTPNAVMFDPDVLDSSVKEHGIDKYGLIIRMDLLGGIALYEDIAMYEHQATTRDEEKRKMCHSTSIKDLHPSSPILPSKFDDDIHELMSTILDKIDRDIHPSEDTSMMLFNISSSTSHHRLSSDSNDELFQSLDEWKHSGGILVDQKDVPTHVFDWKHMEQIQTMYHLENCVPADEYNKRFGEIDKLLQKQHDIYVAPHPIEVPYYLCVKISSRSNTIAINQERQNKNHIDNVYGRKVLEHEYWFSVPKDKVDHLYTFFLRWNPDRSLDPLLDDPYSDENTLSTPTNRPLSNSSSKHNESSSAKGFVLLANDDPELADDYTRLKNKNNNSSKPLASSDSDESKKQHYLKRQNTLLKEWEIISVDEIYRRINATHANHTPVVDIGIPAPKLLQPSILISEDQSKQILLELPARVHGLNWKLVFSTEKNGFSLTQMYRRSMEIDQDSPALILVKDVEQNIFGAYISQQLMISEGFYGTGESFLFTFYPDFQVFHWTGHNQFFVKGDVKSLGIGSGDGNYGLWLDADLYRGRTCHSKTFDNTRLSSNEDFIIANVEVWSFID